MNATTPKIHEWTGPTGVFFREIQEPSGTYYREGTPRAVISALEIQRVAGNRVRFFLGDPETGAQWHEENEVSGYVGRTTGEIKMAILLETKNSSGGGIIMTDNILRLLVDGREVYRHPKYVDAKITLHNIEPIKVPSGPALTVRVDIDGNEWANFSARTKAERWKAFMEGKRMTR